MRRWILWLSKFLGEYGWSFFSLCSLRVNCEVSLRKFASLDIVLRDTGGLGKWDGFVVLNGAYIWTMRIWYILMISLCLSLSNGFYAISLMLIEIASKFLCYKQNELKYHYYDPYLSEQEHRRDYLTSSSSIRPFFFLIWSLWEEPIRSFL